MVGISRGSPGVFRLDFVAEEGRRYWIQFSPDLSVWEDSGEPVVGTGLAVSHDIETGGTDRGFFRVLSEVDHPVPEGFALIPPGSFRMGDSLGEGFDDERPVHTVKLAAFFLGLTEVTYRRWQQVYEWALANGYRFDNPGEAKGSEHPVQQISWHDAVKWCNAASEREGLAPVYRFPGGGIYRWQAVEPTVHRAADGYRLPTEAEWEKAARGGRAGARFPWGETITHSQANYRSFGADAFDVSPTRGNHPDNIRGREPFTSPVGSFAPNRYGLYDTAGNVWEWCHDWFESEYYGRSPEEDPRGPDVGPLTRVIRGGSWDSGAYQCRSSARGHFFFNRGQDGIGLRLARNTPPPPPPAGFVLVRGGTFQMGDSFLEGELHERPVHTVYISAFWMAQTGVTFGRWQEVHTWALANGYRFDNPGEGKGSEHPVQQISWHDAVKWCNAASERENLTPVYRDQSGGVHRTGRVASPMIDYGASGYRLPSEAEWEKAARGGLEQRRFPWGDTITHSHANYASSSAYAYDTSPTRGSHPAYDDGRSPFTSPVGSFAANGYGLHDMAGNVWEWCNDWWDERYYWTSPDGDPAGPLSGTERIIRGGAYFHLGFHARPAYRLWRTPETRARDIGFRLARSRAP